MKTSIVVLAVDGLRASALGAYGNTWYGTPSLDRLASESCLFDNALAHSIEPAAVYRALLGEAPSLPERLEAQGHDSVFVTDEPSIRELPIAEEFNRVSLVPSPEAPKRAEHPAEIAAASTLALLIDQLEQCASDRPVLGWAHLRFASGPWDAPLDLAGGLLGEDDPSPPEDLASPNGKVDESENAEFAFQSTVRYAAQVMALDHCLGVLTGALDDVLGSEQYVLAVVGLRGFALGEHGRVGIDEPRPYSEMRHTPLLVRPAGGANHRRFPQFLVPGDLPDLLLADSADDFSNVGRKEIVLASAAGQAWRDEHWMFYQPDSGECELYSKPDDRWEMNDVAAREHHTIEELEQRLKP